ncbi:MAG: MarR family transcriptional regulator [Henriciella sp.]|uniref:MarR family winged helix-turn-helix transcriptional regulator n=1 Tax=Henriciella sp. TaxID=1968823 RepID=UPI000C0F1692|nr:MarR family transcriptional regulator [Henriciella sp.]MAN74397.1 MarR family transcriptional regulator [Henriciella sp.]MBF34957.1 MarR family transcriptional regulator [Hyphomonadaceae bacterium]MBK74540.1 MarR family transcriptional regulator [Henriciella sp.]PHR77259.1 MAG: MarR family transcriptional regulator [Henriciella sp.]
MASEVNQKPGETGRVDPRLFLREEELDNGIALLLASERIIATITRKAQKPTGLSATSLRLLMTIRFEPDLTVSELRDLTGATTPTLARLLGELDKESLIVKRQGGRDARRRRLTVSPEGEALLRPLVEQLRSALREAYRDAGANAVSGTRAVLEALTK